MSSEFDRMAVAKKTSVRRHRFFHMREMVGTTAEYRRSEQKLAWLFFLQQDKNNLNLHKKTSLTAVVKITEVGNISNPITSHWRRVPNLKKHWFKLERGRCVKTLKKQEPNSYQKTDTTQERNTSLNLKHSKTSSWFPCLLSPRHRATASNQPPSTRRRRRTRRKKSTTTTSWWFQPIWNILVKLCQIGSFPQVGGKNIKNLWVATVPTFKRSHPSSTSNIQDDTTRLVCTMRPVGTTTPLARPKALRFACGKTAVPTAVKNGMFFSQGSFVGPFDSFSKLYHVNTSCLLAKLRECKGIILYLLLFVQMFLD